MPEKAPTDPTMAKANKPLDKALDGDDGGETDGGDTGDNGTGDPGTKTLQGLQTTSEP